MSLKNVTKLFNVMKITCSDELYSEVIKWSNKPLVSPSNICQGKFTKLQREEAKKEEKEWGNMINNKLFNKTSNTVNWTTILGEYLVKKTLEDAGQKVTKPKSINGYKPDWETEEYIYEVKTRNWTTTGTAGEKVFGVPYKYSDIPRLYGKPLKIVCVAYQEYELQYSNTKIFGDDISDEKKEMLALFEKFNITFIRFSELINTDN